MVTPVGVVLGPHVKKLPDRESTRPISHIYNENHLYGIGLI